MYSPPTPEIRLRASTSLRPASRSRRLSLEHDGAWIRPLLVSDEYCRALASFKPLVARPVSPLGVWTVYLVEAPGSATFVTHTDLDHLGIDVERLHTLSLDNLPPLDLFGSVRRACAAEGLVRLRMVDAYVAARLFLVPEHLNPGEEVGVVITDRDSLTLLRPTDAADWRALAALADVPPSDRLILNRPVRVTRDGFTLWQPDDAVAR